MTLLYIPYTNVIFANLDAPLSERESITPFTQSWWWNLGKDLMGVVFKRLLFGKFHYEKKFTKLLSFGIN